MRRVPHNLKSLYISEGYGLAYSMTLASYEQFIEKSRQWSMAYLGLAGGAQLRYGIWKSEQLTQGHVLLIPGRGEFIEKYTEVADEWAQRGFQVISLDLRGQGGSSRLISEKSHIDSFDTYLSDLRSFWDHVWVPRVGDSFALTHGHSTGANILLRQLATKPQAVDGAIVTPTLFDISTARLPLNLPLPIIHTMIDVLGRLAPTAYALGEKNRKPKFAGNPYTHDERRFNEWMQMMHDNPGLAVKGVTFGWVRAARRGRPALEAALQHIITPYLAHITPNDGVVDGPAQRQLRPVRFVEYPDDGHEILRAPDATRARFWAETDRFVAEIRQNLPEARRKKIANKLNGPGL
jgi:lysophospholipase